jgi:REP element-mobilizing transposase RayT
MARKYAIYDQQAIHFVTFTVINWLDVFIRDEYRQIIIDSLIYCSQHKGLNVHAYCIMTSHIHLILSVRDGHNLSDVIRDMKTHTAVQLRKAIREHPGESRRGWLLWMGERAGKKNKRNADFQLWQQHNHPIELSTVAMTEQRLDYIHNNPVEAGFVDDPTAWVWSSCRAYETGVDDRVVTEYL